MKINYCLPIIKSKKTEVLETIKNNSDYDFYEIWLDYIEDLDDAFIREIMELWGKIIVVFRRKNLEQVQIRIKNSLDIIKTLNKSSVFVDLDIYNQKELLEQIKNNNLEINKIVSYHNYESTPNDKNLREIIDTMKKYNPSIFKIATYCRNRSDSLRLLNLLLELNEQHVKSIILGMGQEGISTRLFGTIWGNEMIFTPLTREEKSAEGQFTKEEYEKIFMILDKLASRRSGPE